jgi:hypothetical protein
MSFGGEKEKRLEHPIEGGNYDQESDKAKDSELWDLLWIPVGILGSVSK